MLHMFLFDLDDADESGALVLTHRLHLLFIHDCFNYCVVGWQFRLLVSGGRGWSMVGVTFQQHLIIKYSQGN